MAVATVDVGGLRLAAHVARPTGGPRTGLPGVVLVPGYPSGADRGASAPATHPALADRIAQEMGWVALALNPRGTGGSQGNFSLDGWFDDVLAAAEHLNRNERANGVWLAGFGTGGAISICAGARDLRVRGVAALGCTRRLRRLGPPPEAPRRALAARRHHPRRRTFLPRSTSGRVGLRELRAAEHAGELAPRALLLVHGSEDQLVPEADARTIAEAHGTADLRVIRGAGHNLRQDPRAMAVLLGWLDRQRRRVPF